MYRTFDPNTEQTQSGLYAIETNFPWDHISGVILIGHTCID